MFEGVTVLTSTILRVTENVSCQKPVLFLLIHAFVILFNKPFEIQN